MVDAALTPLFTTQPYTSAIPPSTITGARKRNSKPGTTTIETVLKTQKKGMQQRCQMRSWTAKEQGNPPNITWNVHRQATPYQCGMKQYQLCLEEKLTIAKADKNITLNKRFELIGKCCHKAKFKLKSFKITDPH